MTKRECVIAAIEGKDVRTIPSSFSLHFPKDIAFGMDGVKAHLDFFNATDTDILKIMNENLVPYFGTIETAADYQAKIPVLSMKDSFMVDQVDLTKEVLKRCDANAFTLGTLHGILASGLHPLEKMGLNYDQARKLQVKLLREDPFLMLDAMKRIADVMCELAQTYISLGIDGVYYAALGGESSYMSDEEFKEWIEPLDKQIMSAIKEARGYCFLHICKDNLNMQRYKSYAAYADVINWGVYEVPFSMEDGRKLFPNKTIMGGLPNRHGVLVEGTLENVKDAVRELIRSFGRKGLILGADCTLDTYQDLGKIRTAVEAARELNTEN